jgi:hypothetical protein
MRGLIAIGMVAGVAGCGDNLTYVPPDALEV